MFSHVVVGAKDLRVTKAFYDTALGTLGPSAGLEAAVDAFHAPGIKAGGTDEGAPGPRPTIEHSYATYLRNSTGNKLVDRCMKQP